MRPIAFVNIAAALLFAGALASTVARTAPVAAATAPESQAQPAQTAPATPAAGYIGAEACATCHEGYDKNVEKTKHGFAASHGSYEDLLADKTVDAVYVSTPHPLHHRITLDTWSTVVFFSAMPILNDEARC